MNFDNVAVSAVVPLELQQQASEVMRDLGVSFSELVIAVYKQLIATQSLSFIKSDPKLVTADSFTNEEFIAMLHESYQQAQEGIGLSLDEAFELLNKDI